MPTVPAQPDQTGWARLALAVVLAVTALRLVALGFNRIDLFVDESQYWFWGRNLDFGYYSKPPLIGWLIGAVTRVAGSDAPFWVRMPGALLHGATAMVLGALAARLFGARSGFWVAVSYVTAPFAAVGGLLISTDTVMAPAYAVALYGWFRLAETRAARFAVLVGVAAGLAFLAKYAAIYFLISAALVAVFLPSLRIGWRNGLVVLAVFAAIISVNVIWNLTHGLVTVHHTMGNVGWVEDDEPPTRGHLSELISFFGGQFAVSGPVLFGAFLFACLAALGPGGDARRRGLVAFSLPVLLIVCVQAYLAKAYANWALATYFAGMVLAVPYLLDRVPWLLKASLVINGAFAVLLPLATITAPFPQFHGRPLMHRYLGRADLSRQITHVAEEAGVGAVYAEDRDVLADLFYTGRGSGLKFYAPRRDGRPHNYYEQYFALPQDTGPVLYLLAAPPLCGGQAQPAIAEFDTDDGAYDGTPFKGYLLPPGCVYAPQ